MKRTLIKREPLRRFIGLVAVCALLVQAVLMGVAFPAGDHPRRTASAHAGHHVDCPQCQAPDEPAPPSRTLHCTWCILCGKLGVALAPPPVVADVLSPERDAVRWSNAFGTEIFAGRSASVLPVGARAPPPVVA
jgi:hypothetical protein